MMTIKDLSATQELDSKAMSDVRGGADIYSNIYTENTNSATGGLVGIVDNKNTVLSENKAVDFKVKKEKTDITSVAVGLDAFSGVGLFPGL